MILTKYMWFNTQKNQKSWSLVWFKSLLTQQKGLTIIERDYSFSNGQVLMKSALKFVGLNTKKEGE